MDFANILYRKVKPELNHIYTQKPFMTSGGLDCGWYCREHALHLYALAILMRKHAEICLGDFILCRPFGDTYFSVGDSSDHAWCRIDGCSPVDVSMTVKHLYPDIPDIALVLGNRPDLATGFSIEYFSDISDTEFMDISTRDTLTIAYNEKIAQQHRLLDLLADPFQFLHRPPPGNATFPEIFGTEVFYAITHHCYRLATEQIQPLSRYRNPKSTVRQIMKYNPNPRNSIERLLQVTASEQ